MSERENSKGKALGLKKLGMFKVQPLSKVAEAE